MENRYILYYDSGTTNTRAYLLDAALDITCTLQKQVGSKDSAISGSNRILIQGMKELYDEILKAQGLEEQEITEIYASGMITSPYGLKEIPHLVLPLSVPRFAESVVPFYEKTCFKRTIHLIPGLRTGDEEMAYVNNMRGEEVEIIGAMDEFSAKYPGRNAAFILPGSHTHVTYIENHCIAGIISNFTGELFYALKNDTILSPVLSVKTEELASEMVREGYENLQKFGFTRALYICHAMRLFRYKTERDRLSYGEGVIMGGVRQSLEYYCRHYWKGCDTVAIISNPFMYRLYRDLFQGSDFIREVLWLPISENKSYAIQGLKEIINQKGGRTNGSKDTDYIPLLRQNQR